MVFFGVMPETRTVECVIASLVFEEFIHIVCVVLCLGVVEGKVEWRGRLSETIKGTGMRGSGKEVQDSRTIEKMILRAF